MHHIFTILVTNNSGAKHFSLSDSCTCTESPSPLNSTGLWNFYCEDGSINGTVSVVPGLHIISVTTNVPQDCYAIGTGDVVLWVLHGGNQTCEKNVTVESDDGQVFFTGKVH